MNDPLRDWARRYPHEDPEVLAERALLKLRKVQIIPLVAEHLARLQRLIAHENEVRAFTEVFRRNRGAVAMPMIVPTNDLFRDLFLQRFSVGDGREVTWGDATVEDHEARIAFLELQARGLMDTVERHRASIALITAAGATCLKEAYASAA